MFAGIISGLFGLVSFLFACLLGLAGFAFWLWMLIHAIGNKGLTDGERIVWVLVIIFLPLLGSILYFFIGRTKGAGAIGA
jgi:Phospholipase_D-nuclease N-terminal